MTFEKADFHQPVDFSYASFQDAIFAETTAHRETSFKGATAHLSSFIGSVFKQSVDFRFVSMDWAYFRGATFGGEANFRDATFGVADFSSGDLDADLNVPLPAEYDVHPDHVSDLLKDSGGREVATAQSPAEFKENALFGFSSFTDRAIFTGVRFSEYVRFLMTEFNKGFFDHARFEDVAHFARVTFRDIAIFDLAAFADGQFHDTEFAKLVSFRETETEDTATPIDFFRSTMRHIVISHPPGCPTYYDFSFAMIGEATLLPRDTSENQNPFDFLRIYETTFEGFDFTEYHDLLAPDWKLADFEGSTDSARDDARDIDPALLEGTYLKAKNGAKMVGDDTAAAEFFKHQMRQRKTRHERAAKNAEGLVHPLRHRLRKLGNQLLEFTSGYGENPIRVVQVASGLVLLFALLFAGLFELVVIPAGGTSPTYNWRGTNTSMYGFEYVVFSLQSFVAFLLEGGVDTGNIAIQFFASLEAFLGAFFIALFVFALTRSLNR